ncbi:MAG: hypothetical protein LBD10_03185 [Desulfobulbus sp.]|jgi:hypothetical protein|uniref:hypothetical protein n=1 Tax=Desulfobulbus sp. TaxID=895 RepID=UPI0028433F5B|nr:hypothetical protein [Desulfobulbus sp.]MDR2549192.1 hypothetical protein [Desulfobulbus sp.]
MSKKTEMQTGDLWDALGSLADDQATQVLVHLFTRFEQRRQQSPDDPAAEAFFRMLAAVVENVQSCNVNRR